MKDEPDPSDPPEHGYPLGPGLEDPDPGIPPEPERTIDRRRRFNLRGRSLREFAARGMLINTAFQVGLSALGLMRGFALAIFLTREDYGLWGITIVALNLVVTLRSVGIADKYIQQDDEDQERAFQRAWTLEVILSAITLAMVLAALPVFAIVYDQPEMILPGLLLASNIITGPMKVGLWVFYRHMEFFRQRMIQALEPLVAIAVSIPMAIAGAGYWSLFVGVTAGVWVSGLVALFHTPYRLRWNFDMSTLKEYWRFSAPLLFASIGGVFIGQTAMFATEAELGLAGVGALTLAAQITQFTDRVDGLVTGTLYPAIAAIRDRSDLLYESFVKSNRLALIWAVPFGFGLSLFSHDLVGFVLGDRWVPAVPLLEVFGVVAALGHIGFNWTAYFRAVNNTRPMAIAAVAAALTFAASLPLLFAYGLRGLAWATAIQMVVHVGCRAFYLRRLFDGFAFLLHALRSIVPALPAGAVVLAARALDDGERSGLTAMLELVTFFGLCALFTWLLERALLREALGYLRGAVATPAAERA